MRVKELWRYPVKSLQGERLDAIAVDAEGLDGDRHWAIFDAETGFGLTARRVPALLFAAARWRADGTPEISLPDGTVTDDDQVLSDWLGRSVSLRSTTEAVERRYENPGDFEHETGWGPFDGASGAFHDTEGAHVSIVSTATMGAWEPRRFRANVIVDGTDAEDDLVGHEATLGSALLQVRTGLERCVMVTRPQPGGVAKDLDVLRTIHRERRGRLAVGATVTRPGQVAVGDPLAPV